MNNKKTAFTLIEIMITLALTVMIFGIISSIFITGNKVFHDSDVKSTFQIEGQKIQEEISNIGMQAVNIEGYKESINDEDIANEKYIDLLKASKFVDINGGNEEEEEWINLSEAKFKIFSKNSDYDNINNIITNVERKIISYDKTSKKLFVDSNIISDNVESIRIRPSNIENEDSTISETNSIEVNIVLTKKKSFSDIAYPINFAVTFRNNRV